jgi:hypothetical protein
MPSIVMKSSSFFLAISASGFVGETKYLRRVPAQMWLLRSRRRCGY